jgi:NADPH:quinone reductase-like Zn-dependent oxidoreductase
MTLFMNRRRVVEMDQFGPADVLTLREKAPLGDPPAGKVRVHVKAISVNPKDTFVRKGRFRALTGESFPLGTGYDFAGTVSALSDRQGHTRTTGLSPDEAVYGMINGWLGGTCADEIFVPEDELAPAPTGLSFEEAAAIPLAAMTALQALRDLGRLKAGQTVCVSGASGGVGLFAVQIGRALGARVTAVSSRSNEALCREAGATDFVDYAARDIFTTERDAFDVVFDVFGNRSFGHTRASLRAQGVYISTVPSPAVMADAAATPEETGQRARLVMVESRRADLVRLAAMVAAKEIWPHLDATYPLEKIVDAHRHVEGKHTRGKVTVVL